MVARVGPRDEETVGAEDEAASLDVEGGSDAEHHVGALCKGVGLLAVVMTDDRSASRSSTILKKERLYHR